MAIRAGLRRLTQHPLEANICRKRPQVGQAGFREGLLRCALRYPCALHYQPNVVQFGGGPPLIGAFYWHRHREGM